MLKLKSLLCALLAASSTAAFATNFYVVVPNKAKATQAADKTVVTLAAYTLPQGKVGQAYTGFDFNSVLSVTGDSAFTGSGVSWSAGALPSGLSLSPAGVLSGTPQQANLAGAGFTVTAAYKTKSGTQAYTIVVNDVVLHVTQIVAGASVSCAVTTSGGAMCWGDNTYGQLGNNSTANSSAPVPVYGLSAGVASISAGNYHACALTTSGGVKCWGANTNGQLGNNSTTSSLVPADVQGLSSSVAGITAGGQYTCAVTTSGGAKCWGDNSYGQLGNNSTTRNLVPADVLGLSASTASISAGTYHTCAVSTSSGVKCWGRNNLGQLGNNSMTDSLVPVDVITLTSGVSRISVGSNHSCAVTTSGGAKCWGWNNKGQVGNTGGNAILAPVDVAGLTSGVASLSGGERHTCAVTTSGAAKCWGLNGNGQLGNNDTTNTYAPVDVVGLTSGVTRIAAGGVHTCAVTTAGAKCWGGNAVGQLGNNTTTPSAVPTDVINPN